ncbi:MAG TPA: NAD(P)/FAD-dependent oxidoreductase [Bryobacteraceae bacterium]|jgi:NADH dehydrogenase|nr:NAD(P)/FAD-dependent oxidoreductase [Bryobacteraceae bacterium]
MAHRVVIVGGGFAGLYAARSFRGDPVEVTLIDRRNFHVFQPLLYQVATGGLSPGEISAPLRVVVNRQKNTIVVLGEVTGIDVAAREVSLASGVRYPYDTLIVAAGATHHYFGHPEWERVAPGLKTIEDATEMRTRILLAFERAEESTDPAERAALLTFVVVGGGPTGVELAGALGEISRDTLRADFRNINPAESRIFLVEGNDRLLSTYPKDLSARAEQSLIELGVRSRLNARVTAIDANGVTMKTAGGDVRIEAKTVLWAAGVQASPLGRLLGEATGVPVDNSGRVEVAPDLSIPGHPEILVIGDLARIEQENGEQVPGVAPAAMQQGRYAARLIADRLAGKTPKPFHYFDKGSLATIGRKRAVAVIGKLHFSGLLAWLLWLFVHLLYIVEFESRVLIAIQWAVSYFTFNRGARLITGADARLADARIPAPPAAEARAAQSPTAQSKLSAGKQ